MVTSLSEGGKLVVRLASLPNYVTGEYNDRYRQMFSPSLLLYAPLVKQSYVVGAVHWRNKPSDNIGEGLPTERYALLNP